MDDRLPVAWRSSEIKLGGLTLRDFVDLIAVGYGSNQLQFIFDDIFIQGEVLPFLYPEPGSRIKIVIGILNLLSHTATRNNNVQSIITVR